MPEMIASVVVLTIMITTIARVWLANCVDQLFVVFESILAGTSLGQAPNTDDHEHDGDSP